VAKAQADAQAQAKANAEADARAQTKAQAAVSVMDFRTNRGMSCMTYKGVNAPLVMDPCIADVTQKWSYDKDSKQIKSVKNPAMCLDARGDARVGADLLAYSCHNGDNQKWIADDNKISSVQTKNCVDVFGGFSDGAVLQNRALKMWGCHGQNNQKISRQYGSPTTPVVYFPPKLTGFSTTVDGATYTVSASTNRTDYLLGWGVFNGIPPTTDTYANKKWQTADGRYDDNTSIAKTNPPFNGFAPKDYNGEWLSLIVPKPMVLVGYTLSGSLMNWRMYASANPLDPASWVIVDQQDGRSGAYTEEQSFNVKPSKQAYTAFLLKISKARSCGWGRGCMSKLQFYGYPP
jgi:hypothetical protein